MGHVVRESGWCTIDVDTSVGRVFVIQRWMYDWQVAPGQSPWTLAEKRAFHRGADRAIWHAWSNRAAFRVAGRSDFARRFPRQLVPVNLDARWVTGTPHWTVTATKLPPGQFRTSFVNFARRTISLDTNDLAALTRSAGGVSAQQTPVAHEFGHSMGNIPTHGHGDEYPAASAHNADKTSILNIGNQLRARHFDHLIGELNRMIPNTSFTVGRV